jgi:hypothetical protein
VYGHSRLLYDAAKELSWVYVSIPKSASSYMKAVFKRGHWYNYQHNHFWDPESNQPDERWRWYQHKVRRTTVLEAPKKFVVVLRDIVDRWTSAVGQVISSENLACSEFDRWVNDPRCFPDNHLEPQISFIHGLDPDSITWFWADRNLRQNITRWAIHNKLISQLMIEPTLQGGWFNQTVFKSIDVQNAVFGLREYVRQDPARVQRIIDAYPQDHELINTVEFFNNSRQVSVNVGIEINDTSTNLPFIETGRTPLIQEFLDRYLGWKRQRSASISAMSRDVGVVPSFIYYDVDGINSVECDVIAIDAVKENYRCIGSFQQYRTDRHYIIFSGGSWKRSIMPVDFTYDLVSYNWMLYDLMESWFNPGTEWFYQDKFYSFDYPKPIQFGYVGGTARQHRLGLLDRLLSRIDHNQFYFKLEGRDHGASTSGLDLVPSASTANEVVTLLESRYNTFDDASSAHWRSYSKQLFDRCNWQLVLEPDFHTPGIFYLTEKTGRVLISGQPFVIAASNGFLGQLHDLGFQTYGQLWNEDYDHIADAEQKLDAIADLCAELCGFDWVAHRAQLESIANHNLKNLLHLHRQSDQEFQHFEHVMSNIQWNSNNGPK